MIILNKDLKKGEIKIKVENLDDLWHLSQLIEVKDLVRGKSSRKIKIGNETERKQKDAVSTLQLPNLLWQ